MMAKISSNKVERINTGRRGARKTKLTRLELYLMSRGPAKTTERKLFKATNRAAKGAK